MAIVGPYSPFKSPHRDPAGVHEADSVWHLVNGPITLSEPQKPVYIDGKSGETLTYGQARIMSRKVAYSLVHDLRLKPQDTVCVFASNSIRYATFVHATQAAGLVCTFSNPAYTEPELAHILSDSDVQVIVTDVALLGMATSAARTQGIPHTRIFLLGKDGTPGFESIWSLMGSNELEPPHMNPRQARTTTALRCYSSGTTGRSKGVNLSHANFHAVVRQLSSTLPKYYRPDGRWLCFIPMFHISGVMVFQMLCPFLGCTSVILPRFEFIPYLECIQRYRITMGHVVPPIAVLLAKSAEVDKYDLSSLEIMRCGAAPLGKDLQTQIEDRLGVRCVGAYGMTETTGGGCSDDPATRKVGGNGPILPAMEARIIDGEMQFRGPNVMIGYHNNSAANQDAFTEDGWLRTGDIVVKDEDGHIFVTDRIKELIKYKSFQVPPAELEDLLLSRSDVADAGVVPEHRPEQATELPKAYVVLKNPKEASLRKAQELIAWLAERTAHYKKMRGGIVFVDSIPKNASGKILRRQLKERTGDVALGAEDLRAKL